MMKSKYKKLRNLFFVLSFVATFGPFIYYCIKAFIDGEPVEKFALTMFSIAAIIIAGAAAVRKIHLRSVLWILLLGVYICLDNLVGVILVVAICTILDELIFSPLYHRYSDLYRDANVAGKVFDERMENK